MQGDRKGDKNERKSSECRHSGVRDTAESLKRGISEKKDRF